MRGIGGVLPGDRGIVFAASFMRAVANGLIGVLAGIYLAELGFDPAAWGAVLGAGIAGTAAGAAGVMFWGDRIGRKRWLVALGVLGAAGGIVFAFSSQIVVLGVAAFLGMLNSLGKDRAAALAIEQAILPSTGGDAERTRAFAWYNVIQDVGHALGAALAVLPPFLREFAGVNPLDSLRAAMILYALLYAATAVLYLGLTSQAEAPTAALRVEVSPQSRSILAKMSLLFALDSFAGGVTNLARMCARAIAPVFAGSAMQMLTLGAPIMAAAGLKILYDALLYVSFRKLKAPEER